MKLNCLILAILLSLIAETSSGQQFVQEWEFADRLIYIGDIDGDGVGEFVKDDYNNSITTFYDALTHSIKWTITGKRFNDELFSAEKSNLHPSYLIFPSIDYNGDGKREIFFEPSDGKGIIITDVVNNTEVFEWYDPQIDWAEFQALSDVDGDGILELVFVTASSTGYTTYVYSTGVQITSLNESYENIPNKYKVLQNYPNPFNPSTTIEYQITNQENVKIKIYDINGRLIKNLIDENKNAGSYIAKWNGKNDAGLFVSTGTYFYQIQAGDFVQTKKMILLK